MIYFCADDFGLAKVPDEKIRELTGEGALNKVAVFPNFAFPEGIRQEDAALSLHINLVEGKAMAGKSLLTNDTGEFAYTFFRLFVLSLIKPKALRLAASAEMGAQIRVFRENLGKDVPLFLDSHQHTHMIPVLFKALRDAVETEGEKVEYLRIPTESVRPFLRAPSLYFTYKPQNLIKQWLLKFLWLFNKKTYKAYKLPRPLFCGVLFSGKMDKRVEKVLPHYLQMAEKQNRDLEVLFHPGYGEENGVKDLPFRAFYTSPDRKAEYETVKQLKKRGVW